MGQRCEIHQTWFWISLSVMVAFKDLLTIEKKRNEHNREKDSLSKQTPHVLLTSLLFLGQEKPLLCPFVFTIWISHHFVCLCMPNENVCALLSRCMALIKGSHSIYPRKWFCLLRTGKWALKPDAPQPIPHVEGTGLVVSKRCWGRANYRIGRGTHFSPEAWSLIGCCQKVCGAQGWCVWCVQVVNSSEHLLLIPRFSCGNNYFVACERAKNESSLADFMDLCPFGFWFSLL